MNTPSTQQTLYLQVMNPESLEGGSLPTHSFDHHGGTIGSKGTNWLLHDYTGDIAATHAEITTRDNHYCLIDRSGRTRVNSSVESIGLNRILRLNEGDTLQLGKYRIRVRLHDISAQHIVNQKQLSDINMVELVDQKKHAHKKGHLLAHAVGNEIPLVEAEVRDPVDSILIKEVPREVLDPLAAFSNSTAPTTTHKQFVNQHDRVFTDIKQVTPDPASDYPHPKQITHNESSGDIPIMSSNPKNPDDPHWSEHYHPRGENAELDHVVIAPLLRGMGISIEEMDTEKAHDFLIEAGQAVRAAVSGIQALYQKDHTTLNPAMLSRNLQPIEDNPLRLRQPYEQTVDALFSPDRSRVHLSPPAAIDESLAQLGQHQDSIIVAIQESLNTLLQAFSPDVLKSRFQRYAKTGELNKQDDAWAWQMYSAYYSELISSRQIGFEKLFWEVFEQAYDRAMRQPINNQTTGNHNDED